MRDKRIVFVIGALAAWGGAPGVADAAESSFSIYTLGTGAVGAGQTPPPGWYFTTSTAYEHFEASKSILFGGTKIIAKADAPVFVGNMLAVFPQEFLGGHLSVSATGGVGNLRLDASVVGGLKGEKVTQGTGAIDTSVRTSLGWELGPTFSHKISVTELLPTGRYDLGFNPNIGLNRFGTDVSWGATYIEPTTKVEFSGTAGFTYEGYNPATQYRSGNAVHLEEAIIKHFANGFQFGAISYQYQQVSGDSGAGATLGPFRTREVGIGPSAGYTTLVGGHIVVLSGQVTTEVATEHRLKETAGSLALTVKF